MKIILIPVAITLFLCSAAIAGQGGGGESTKPKPSPKKNSGTKSSTTPARPAVPPARPKSPTVASLIVNTNLPNATVTINERTAGATDSNGYLQLGSLKSGSYTVTITKTGYQPDKRVISLSAGQNETLSFELKPITQALTISSTPPECEIYIDEILRGRTDGSGNARVADVPIGEHRVTIRKSRYREAIFPLSLSFDKEGQINANLELAIGFLTVTTDTPNPRIDISGLGHFDKSINKFECPPGTYTVTVSSPLYITSRKEVSVSAGQEAELSVTLEADRGALTDLAHSYFAKNEFAAFTDIARRAIDAGGSIEFRLQHHHAFGIELHPIKLTLTATNISFDPQVSQPLSCSFRQFTHPLDAVVTAKFEEADGSLLSKRQKGVYLKLTLEDPKNPKKTFELNFADLASSFVKSPNGKTVMSYRAQAPQALTAISSVFQYAISKAHSSETSNATSGNVSAQPVETKTATIEDIYRLGGTQPTPASGSLGRPPEPPSPYAGPTDTAALYGKNVEMSPGRLIDLTKDIDAGKEIIIPVRLNSGVGINNMVNATVVLAKTGFAVTASCCWSSFAVTPDKILELTPQLQPGQREQVSRLHVKIAIKNKKGDKEDKKDFYFFNTGAQVAGGTGGYGPILCNQCDDSINILYALLTKIRSRQ